MRRISVTEGETFCLESVDAQRLRLACVRLAASLRPSFRLLTEELSGFRINGVIGTIDLGGGTLLEVTPKVTPEDDWIRSVIDLLVGTDRVDIAGERAAGLSANRRSLLEVLAAIYAARLERAVKRDGPLLVLNRRQQLLPILRGKLRVTEWTNKASWKPYEFPTETQVLDYDNGFSRVLARAAAILSSAVASPETRSRLAVASQALRPGLPNSFGLNGTEVHNPLPSQWSIYKGAWSIARAVLLRSSIIGTGTMHVGVSIAVEAWPLLETLLERTLFATSVLAESQGSKISVARKTQYPLLTDNSGNASRQVVPDGRLVAGDATVATFEAKYKRRSPAEEWPNRADVYQALITAAACGAPLSVLVYPDAFDPILWKVQGMNGQPAQIAAIGLGLFDYRQGSGDLRRGQQIYELLKSSGASDRVTP